jgi:periplasmic divalent cation tolerance protein
MRESPDQLVLALTTEASLELAENLARRLLERRLAACVALQPLRSIYRWQGELHQAEEVQLLIKTSAARLEALTAAVHGLHSYTTPEWITWPAGCSGGYGAWLVGACAPAEWISPDGAAPAPGDWPGDAAPTG